MNVGLRIDFAVAEYFLAILTIQSPLRHAVKLSGEGQVSPPPIMPRLNRLKMFKKEDGKS